MGDEFKDADVDRPIRLSLTLDSVSPEAMNIFFGGDSEVGKPLERPTHSVVLEHVEVISGRPPYPHLIEDDAPWWRPRRRRMIRQLNEDRIRIWELACRRWEADGCPDREILVRTYIPNAQITEV